MININGLEPQNFYCKYIYLIYSPKPSNLFWAMKFC